MAKVNVRGGALVLAAVLVAGCEAGSDWAAGDVQSIDRAEVERVISVLAADDMRGRRAFTEDAERAADFLAAEFAAAGLQPLEGTSGHLQRFMVNSFTTQEASASVAGADVPAERVVARLGAESIDWSPANATVLSVGADEENARDAMVRTVFQGSGDRLVFVHPSHEATFNQLSGFLRGPNRVVGDAGESVVAVLTDAGVDADFAVSASASVMEEPLVNVVGMVPGVRTDEFVLFSAHYDHIGIRPPVEGDSIANGANDDASGTAAVVALAKYFAERGTPERSLLFVAFTAEEGGGYGSRYFSEQLDPDQIVAMFNIEMIGKPAVEGPNTAWITGFERSSFGPLLQEAVEGTVFSFYPDPYPAQNLFYRSDNATLARLGVPAHSISTTPIDVDPDYHQVSDHVETLDLEHMTNAIRAIATAAETMVTGEATPTRVDPATVN